MVGSGVCGEILVDGANRARPLSDRGGNPLHGSQPHIADGKDPGCRGLERQRLPAGEERIDKGISGEQSIGEDEPLLVQLDSAVEPRRRGLRAYEAKEGDAFFGVAIARRRVLEDHAFEVGIAGEGPDLLGVGQNFDVRIDGDAVNEVFRHAARKVRPANHDRNPAAFLTQVEGGLPGRVSTTDHHNI